MGRGDFCHSHALAPRSVEDDAMTVLVHLCPWGQNDAEKLKPATGLFVWKFAGRRTGLPMKRS